jgi:Flp pilus assembly protein TadG
MRLQSAGSHSLRSRVFTLLRSFRNDTSGNIFILFSFVLVIGFLLIGGVFDFDRRMRGQQALLKAADSAALVAKQTESAHVTKYGILQQAQARSLGQTQATAFFRETIALRQHLFGDAAVADPTFAWNDVTGAVTVSASASVPSFFPNQVFSSTHYSFSVQSQAEMNVGIPTEIVLSLDSTTSMFAFDGRTKTRFTLLREASLAFVNDVFDAAASSNNLDAVRVAVVPWATTVNVRGEAPAATDYSAFSMTTPTDKGSQNHIVNPLGRSDRVNVNPNDFLPVDWRGCISGSSGNVESKTAYNDGYVSGWNALSVAPASMSSDTYKLKVGNSCTGQPNQSRYFCPSQQSSSTRKQLYIKTPFTCLKNSVNSCITSTELANASQTQQPCVADYSEPKIQNNTVSWCSWITKTEWESDDGATPTVAGPNENCPAPMLGLSANRKQVIEAINRMTPATGGTHQDVGLRWGLRALSPNNSWPTFFGLQKMPKPYSSGVEKVMVLITDGDNQPPSVPGFWNTSTTDSELNTMTTEWCNVIRNTYNIKIYTVAMNVTDNNAKNLLKNCVGADHPDRAFQVDAANLRDALRTIGRQLTNLRLTM